MNIQQACNYLQLTYPQYRWKIQSEVSYVDSYLSFDATKLNYWVSFSVPSELTPKHYQRATTLRAAVQQAVDQMMLYELEAKEDVCTSDL